jgi:hypothetical protein
MKKENNLYNYSTPKSGNEETSFFLTKGRITSATLYKRIALSICIYGLSYLIFHQFWYYFDDILYGFVATLHFYLIPFFLIVFVLVQGAKRMHDINESGWNFLIPGYNIYRSFDKGTIGSNDYGIDPRPITQITYFDELEQNEVVDNIKQINEPNEISLIGVAFIVVIIFGIYIFSRENIKTESSNTIEVDTNSVAIDTDAIKTSIDDSELTQKSNIDSSTTSENSEENNVDIKTVVFENNSRSTIYLAYAFWNNSKWETIGWFEIEPNKSEDFSLPESFYGDSIYWYAEDSNDGKWEGKDGVFCVTHPDAFHYYTTQSNENCNEERNFYKLSLTGTYTVQGLSN